MQTFTCQKYKCTMNISACIYRQEHGDDPYCKTCPEGSYHTRFKEAASNKTRVIKIVPKKKPRLRGRPKETAPKISETLLHNTWHVCRDKSGPAYRIIADTAENAVKFIAENYGITDTLHVLSGGRHYGTYRARKVRRDVVVVE